MVKVRYKAVRIAYPVVPKKKFIRRYRAPRRGFGKVHSEYFRKLASDLVQERNRIELDYLMCPKEYQRYADNPHSTVRFKMMAGLSANLFSADCIIAIVELPDFETRSVLQTTRR